MNEVGERLKEARKAKGYTLDDLQQITKIQKRYLVAIEEGNLEVLPGNFYARAFIKQYADTVGVDGEKLLEEYTDYIPSPNDQDYTTKMATTQTRSRSRNNDWISSLQTNLPVILIVLLVLAIVVAIYIAIVQGDSDPNESMIVNDQAADSVQISTNSSIQEQAEETDSASDTSEENTSGEEEDTTEEEPAEEQTIEVDTANENAATFNVTASAEEEHSLVLSAVDEASWVSVEADGTMLDQGTIQPGESMDVTIPAGTGNMYLVIGNGPQTTLELNGEEVASPPETSGITQRLTFEFSE